MLEEDRPVLALPLPCIHSYPSDQDLQEDLPCHLSITL